MPYKIKQPGTFNFYTRAGEDFEFENREAAEDFVQAGGLDEADEDRTGHEIVEVDAEGYEVDA